VKRSPRSVRSRRCGALVSSWMRRMARVGLKQRRRQRRALPPERLSQLLKWRSREKARRRSSTKGARASSAHREAELLAIASLTGSRSKQQAQGCPQPLSRRHGKRREGAAGKLRKRKSIRLEKPIEVGGRRGDGRTRIHEQRKKEDSRGLVHGPRHKIWRRKKTSRRKSPSTPRGGDGSAGAVADQKGRRRGRKGGQGGATRRKEEARDNDGEKEG